ncbi:MAG: hypothetical protein IJY91_01850 [Oscillospiraceae bacterium]|nr:hypothetical protein [Oscillospiraceae bacterium]
MDQKINAIKNAKHPYSVELNKLVDLLDKVFYVFIVLINVVGFIIAEVATNGLADWAEKYKGDVVSFPVNFFGFFIEMESDSFGSSPLSLLIYIILICVIVSLAIVGIKLAVTAALKSKINALDTLYRTEKLTELLLENNCDLQREHSAS